jgi:hypothetical protein
VEDKEPQFSEMTLQETVQLTWNHFGETDSNSNDYNPRTGKKQVTLKMAQMCV